jgi:hypothetical protein
VTPRSANFRIARRRSGVYSEALIPDKRIGDPRVETPDAIISMGLAGSLDDAFKEATSDMAAWLAEDYKLAPSEIAQVMGAAAEYRVSEAADRNAGVVLKLKKRYLHRSHGRGIESSTLAGEEFCRRFNHSKWLQRTRRICARKSTSIPLMSGWRATLEPSD